MVGLCLTNVRLLFTMHTEYHTPAILPAKPWTGNKRNLLLCHSSALMRFLSSFGSFASASVEFLCLALRNAVSETVGAYALPCKWQLRWSLLCCECLVCAWRQISPYPIVKVYILRYTHMRTFNCVYLGCVQDRFMVTIENELYLLQKLSVVVRLQKDGLPCGL